MPFDAICISYFREVKPLKNSKGNYYRGIDGFDVEYIKNKLDSLIPLQVRKNKARLKLKETIYGKRIRLIDGKEKYYIVTRSEIKDLDKKKVDNIFDDNIRADLKSKLSLTDKDWKELVKNYTHTTRKSPVKKVKMIRSKPFAADDIINNNGQEIIGEFADVSDFRKKKIKGQFKHQMIIKGK